jgi:GTP-binding protein
VKSRRFIDSVVLYASGGNGGNGCVSFRREKFVPKGGPDGGDGGRGGHVILCGSRDEDSLIRLYFTPHQKAGHGGHGRGKQSHGRNGEDRRVPVPCGTEVRDRDSGALLGDILEHGTELVVARGGRGGRGNVHFKRSSHQTPYEHTDGEPGEAVTLRLDLKIVADAGLVGFPNAGKSSLLTRISHAHPKIGAYPFTTLNPIVGTLEFEDYSRLTVADIPGLIEGAHAGHGLGDAFLRHLERSKYLVYVLDMAGVDQRLPHDDYAKLRKELGLYDKALRERPFLVVANKMDLPEARSNLEVFRRETGVAPVPISAKDGDGLPELTRAIYKLREDSTPQAASPGRRRMPDLERTSDGHLQE